MCSACRQIQFTHKRPDEKPHWFLLFLYFSNRTAWRKAIVACKLAIDNMEKEELLRGGENQSTRQRWVLFYWSSAGELRWRLHWLNIYCCEMSGVFLLFGLNPYSDEISSSRNLSVFPALVSDFDPVPRAHAFQPALIKAAVTSRFMKISSPAWRNSPICILKVYSWDLILITVW